MGKKVCLFSDLHISVNPRLWKEAFFYEKLGFDVVILSMWTSEISLNRDYAILKGKKIQYKCYLNLIPSQSAYWFRFFFRVRKRIAAELFKITGVASKWTVSYAPEIMLSAALKENAALYAAHLECAFYTGVQLLKHGKKVSFDFEDWYSRDYLVSQRPVKLLAQTESYALQQGLFCTTTSAAMKKALQNAYKNFTTPFEVIYNGFASIENEDESQAPIRKGQTTAKLLWFSRTIGPGRGIELIIEALNLYQQPVELHLLGDAEDAYKNELIRQAGFQKRGTLFFHSFIQHNELIPFISGFDIGFATEENIGDNKRNTISNKVLQYLQAGIKVIATDTEGQKEVASFFPNTIRIVNASSASLWVKAIEELLEVGNEYKAEQIKTFKNVFSWEVQEEKLVKIIENKL